MRVAIIQNGVVQKISSVIFLIPQDSIAVIVDGLPVNLKDLYDGKKPIASAFSPNPAAADLAATAAKIQAIKDQLASISTTADLKTAVAAINADVNG